MEHNAAALDPCWNKSVANKLEYELRSTHCSEQTCHLKQKALFRHTRPTNGVSANLSTNGKPWKSTTKLCTGVDSFQLLFFIFLSKILPLTRWQKLRVY